MIDAFNASDSVSTGMPDPLFGHSTEPGQITLETETGQLVALLLSRVLASGAEDADQRVPEGFSKILVEIGVNQRIESRVEVANPEEDLDHDVGTITIVAAQRNT